MASNWEAKISDPKERKVFAALSDPAYDFRTVSGLSKEVGLPEFEVRAILDRYPELIRKSAVADEEGRELFTLSSRPLRVTERLALLRAFIVKSVH